jgi:hypothetical protein
MKERQLQRIQLKQRESLVEKYLERRCAVLGWECIKLTSPNRRGVSDRLILAYKGVAVFVELKNEKGKLTKLQKKWHEDLQYRGFMSVACYNKKDVDGVVDTIDKAINGLPAETLSE